VDLTSTAAKADLLVEVVGEVYRHLQHAFPLYRHEGTLILEPGIFSKLTVVRASLHSGGPESASDLEAIERRRDFGDGLVGQPTG
jgi:hypothetical protein